MSTDYPGGIDSFPEVNLDDTVIGEFFNDPNDSIVSIENTLGTDPQGGYADVKARLVWIESQLGGGGIEFVDYEIVLATLTSSYVIYDISSVIGSQSRVVGLQAFNNSGLGFQLSCCPGNENLPNNPVDTGSNICYMAANGLRGTMITRTSPTGTIKLKVDAPGGASCQVKLYWYI